MEALMWRASDVVVSYGVIRGASGTQEKERKQGQASKIAEKARLLEKNAPPSGNGRSYTVAPLPFPSARNLVPAPLRFLWFPSTRKNEEEATSVSGDGRDGQLVDVGYLPVQEDELAEKIPLGHQESDVTVVPQELDVQESGDLGPGVVDQSDTESKGAESEGLQELRKIERGNAAKKWIQNLLNVNFLRKSPRIEVRLPSPEILEKGSLDLIDSVGRPGYLNPCEPRFEDLQQVGANVGSSRESAENSCGCLGCSNEIGENYVVDPAANPLSTLEVPHVNVKHDLESFSKFLSEVPLTELKTIAQSSSLSSLAYMISEIKPSELARYHRMVFVTSSMDIKAAALAQEKAAALAQEKAAAAAKVNVNQSEAGSESNQNSYLSPATAYALAAAATSFLRSQKKETEVRTAGEEGSDLSATKVKVDTAGEEGADLNAAKVSDDIVSKEDENHPLNSGSLETFLYGESNASDIKNGLDVSASDMPAFMLPVTSVVSAEKETKQEVANNLRSLHTCPCEWFACDDKSGYTRFFSIQGSDSFASWQANLLFEPVHFEDPALGVMVHRGIYEAARGLYEQILPCIFEHQKRHGERAKFHFTGHSLGGSLAVLLSLMLNIRGVLKTSALLPVYTFGSPYIMCGGDYLLRRLGLPLTHVQYIVMHRDIVPRTFACNYPDHIAEVLKRVNGTFRDHTCLIRQRLLYAPMGQLIVLQPDQQQTSAPHPLLPSGGGLYLIRHQSHNESHVPNGVDGVPSRAVQVRAAQRAFLNQPHPLEIISDPGAYGSEGSISKNHDPRNYVKAINSVLRQEMRRWRRIQRERRRQLWWPLISADSAMMSSKGASLGVQNDQRSPKGVIRQGMFGPSGISHYVSDLGAGRATFPVSVSGDIGSRFSRYKSLIASQHVQMGMVVLFTARMFIVGGFSVVLAWV